MTSEEARRRQAISHVQAASAREWPRKLVDAWAETLRVYPPDLVERACRDAVAAWDETLVMPVGNVVERAKALRRGQKRRDDDDDFMRPVACAADAACRSGWMHETIPGHTYCPAHNVSWRVVPHYQSEVQSRTEVYGNHQTGDTGYPSEC